MCFLKDMLKAEVHNTLKSLKKAHITTRLLTSDDIISAKANAIEAGIISPDEDEAITTGQ